MKTELVAYLSFEDKTKEAMEYYHSIFGGKLEMQTYAEANQADDESIKDKIIHAMLTTDSFFLMCRDAHPKYSSKVVMGNNVALSVVGTDSEKLTGYFNKLSEGGKVEMPLEKQFWGDTFGACEDKFGIHWSINISSTPLRP